MALAQHTGMNVVGIRTVEDMIADSIRTGGPGAAEFLANIPRATLERILPTYQAGKPLYAAPKAPSYRAELAFDYTNGDGTQALPNWTYIGPDGLLTEIPEHQRSQYQVIDGADGNYTYYPESNGHFGGFLWDPDYQKWLSSDRSKNYRPITGELTQLYSDEIKNWSNLQYDPNYGLLAPTSDIVMRDNANWWDKAVANVIGPAIIGAGIVGAAGAAAGLSGAATGVGQSIGMGAADTLGMGSAFSGGGFSGAAGAAGAGAAGSLSQAEMLAAQQLGVDTAGWAGAIEPGAIGFSGLEPGVAEALAASGVPAGEAAAAAKVVTQAGAAKGLTASQILTAAKGGMGALSSLLGGGGGKGGGVGSGLASVIGSLANGRVGGGGSGGTGMSAAAEDSIRLSTDIARDQYDWFKNKVRPIDNMLADEAMGAGGLADQEAQASKAAADVAQAYKRIREQRTREMTGLGLDPSSGRYQYGLDAIDHAEALAGAGAQNKARETARNVGYDKRLAVSQIGRGIPSSSASSLAGLANQQNQIGRQAQADRQANDMARGYGLNQIFDIGKGVYDFGKSSGWWGDSGGSGGSSGGGSSTPAPSVDTGSSGGGFFENIGWNFGGGDSGGSWDDWLGTADW